MASKVTAGLCLSHVTGAPKRMTRRWPEHSLSERRALPPFRASHFLLFRHAARFRYRYGATAMKLIICVRACAMQKAFD